MVGRDHIGAAVAHSLVMFQADDFDAPDEPCKYPDDGQNDPIQQHVRPPNQICSRIVRLSTAKLWSKSISLVSTRMASSACFSGATSRWVS